MKKKSGKAGTPIAPTETVAPHEADVANPGEVEQVKRTQRQTQSGKYGSTKVAPFKPTAESEGTATKKTWIAIELVDDQDLPVPGEPYRVELPDGSVAEGTLDAKGKAKIEGIPAGSCKVTFPKMDGRSWAKA